MLKGMESGIHPLVLQQLIVGALFGDPALFHDDDAVGLTDGGQPMGDDDDGAAPADAAHVVLDDVF